MNPDVDTPPYSKTIMELRKIIEVESPIKKMEIAFKIFTGTLPHEIED